MTKVWLLLCVLALSIEVAADEIQFATSTTTGCFYTTTTCTPSSAATNHGLSFTGAALPSDPATFSSGGALAILLGTFASDGTQYNFNRNGVNFAATVEFTLPETIAGASATDYFANMTGQVNSQGNGTVTVNFDNTPLTFYFANAFYTGSFQFSVQDAQLNLQRLDTVYWYGDIISATQTPVAALSDPVSVPEPASAILLGSGLAALIGALRRKR